MGIIPTVIFAAMIATLTGKFMQKTPTRVVVDVQGVGYDINISLHTYTAIQALDSGLLFIHLKVAEDAFTLFGFAEEVEKEIFLKLIGVSGVGAATARMMLSHLKPTEVVQAIAGANVKLLESVKGIGKKTAERIVLELRDKMGGMAQQAYVKSGAYNTVEIDALEAMVALGITRTQAEQAIKKAIAMLPGNNSVESIIKQALKSL
jgi:holliday junction DNA helicase RuvA